MQNYIQIHDSLYLHISKLQLWEYIMLYIHIIYIYLCINKYIRNNISHGAYTYMCVYSIECFLSRKKESTTQQNGFGMQQIYNNNNTKQTHAFMHSLY